jgi:cytidyltransferase-like protein
MDKETIKKLYLMQVHEQGVSEKTWSGLSEGEKALLEKKSDRYFMKTEGRKQIKVVMTGGVFDIIHLGHLYTLNEAKKHGDILVVSVARDELVLKKKGKLIHPQEVRAEIVGHLKPVDIALVGIDRPEKTLERVGPDVIIYGYDQEPFLKPEGIEVIKLEKFIAPDKYKTRKLIEQLGL